MKKNYNRPVVEMAQMSSSTLMLVGSPNINNSGAGGIDPD